MSLYASDLFDAGTPVSKPKKGKKEKTVTPPSPPSTNEPAAPEPTPEVKVKKERSPAQIAAAEKMRAARQAKKEAAAAALAAAQNDEAAAAAAAEAKATAAAVKKEAAKEKRRLAKLAKQAAHASEPVSEMDVDQVEPKAKRPKKVKDENEPPAWFKAYMKGVQEEQNSHRAEPAPPKEVKAAARVQARESWADPVVRDRVHEENNRHLNALHSQIFGGRKF